MTGEIYDYPTRLLVVSETEGDKAAYLVDLCAHKRTILPVSGRMIVYNGACQCKSFLYRCQPKLRDPNNNGKLFRCKHINWARENCLDFILPHLAANDPNPPEEHL